MSFWDLSHPSESLAVVEDTGRTLTYQELAIGADAVASELKKISSRNLGFLLFEPCISAVEIYLGTLRSQCHVPLLLQPGIHPQLLENLIQSYAPEWIALHANASDIEGYEKIFDLDRMVVYGRKTIEESPALNSELAILLSTSGSTGSEKLVRLSYSAIASNATSITEYLCLNRQDRAVSTLPLAYSFGMSLLNSHLDAGASILLTDKTLMSRDFWDMVRDAQVTSLSGVPSQFDMLRRAGLEKRGLTALRMLTQAGGRLADNVKQNFNTMCKEIGIEFFIMYGQTEAAPRISFVPPHRLSEKIGSIGIPIPGGTMEIDPGSGELVYRGENVMLGYAHCRADLSRGDDCHGVLHTGDLASVDADGYFHLTGRMKRFIKLSGTRVNLDEIEINLGKEFLTSIACVGEDDQMIVAIVDSSNVEDSSIFSFLRERFNIDRGLLQVHRLAELPYTSSGKLDYKILMFNTVPKRQ